MAPMPPWISLNGPMTKVSELRMVLLVSHQHPNTRPEHPKKPKKCRFFFGKNYQVSKRFGFTEKKKQKFRNPWQMRTMDVFNWLDHQQPSLARQLFCKNFQVDAPDGTVFPYWVQQQSSPQCSPIVLKPMEIPPLQWSWLIYLQKPQKSRTYQKININRHEFSGEHEGSLRSKMRLGLKNDDSHTEKSSI